MFTLWEFERCVIQVVSLIPLSADCKSISWHHCMAGYRDFPTLASACRCNSIYKHVVKNCRLPRCRSKCEDSNGVYLKCVDVTVSLPIAFKVVSVLGDHFDEDVGRIFFNTSYFNSSTSLCHCCWRYGGSWQWSGIGLLHVLAYQVSQCVQGMKSSM